MLDYLICALSAESLQDFFRVKLFTLDHTDQLT